MSVCFFLMIMKQKKKERRKKIINSRISLTVIRGSFERDDKERKGEKRRLEVDRTLSIVDHLKARASGASASARFYARWMHKKRG